MLKGPDQREMRIAAKSEDNKTSTKGSTDRTSTSIKISLITDCSRTTDLTTGLTTDLTTESRDWIEMMISEDSIRTDVKSTTEWIDRTLTVVKINQTSDSSERMTTDVTTESRDPDPDRIEKMTTSEDRTTDVKITSTKDSTDSSTTVCTIIYVIENIREMLIIFVRTEL